MELSKRIIRSCGIAVIVLLFGLFIQFKVYAQSTSKTYYIDCAGNDSNTGLSAALPWSTLAKAGSVSLGLGDQLLLKRGCTWSGQTLTLGTNKNGVYVGAYGSGDLPIISNTATDTRNSANDVYVTGSNITIENINAVGSSNKIEANCSNNPVGHIVGYAFGSGAANNILRNSQASGLYAGVYIQSGAYNNKIFHNLMSNNTMMYPLTPTSVNGGDDAGAFGVLIWGDYNEIANNTFVGMEACSYDFHGDGSIVEIYGGKGNNIHHNSASQSNTFSELDLSTTIDNVLAYNLFYSDHPYSIFLNIQRPVGKTLAYNNTAYLTGASAQGVVCSSCATSSFTFKNNIIAAKWKVGYANASFNEGNNIYWLGITSQLPITSTSTITDPKFVNPSTGDFHLQSGSPAINSGTAESITAGYISDLAGVTVENPPERGVFEYSSNVISPTPAFGDTVGDVDRNGVVNVADLSTLLNVWSGLVNNYNYTWDQYADTKLNSMDVDVVMFKLYSASFPTTKPTTTPTNIPSLAPTIKPTVTVAIVPSSTPTLIPTYAVPTATPIPVSSGNHVVISMGDISRTTGSPSLDVANAIKSLNPEAILMLGDYDQGTGTLSDILAYPDKLYGPKPNGLYSKIYPAAGPTHDVSSCSNQLGYSDYWGRDAFKGYSFDLGTWHFISLPSAATRYGCDVAGITAWLKDDLATHTNKCVFAYWHEPYFTSPTSSHTSNTSTKPWVDLLVAAHADILAGGHQNGNFEAYYPQNSSFVADPNGIQAFVTATGGQSPYSFSGTASNLISRSSGAYGPVVFNLGDNGTYTWQFIKVAGSGAAPSPASGTGICR